MLPIQIHETCPKLFTHGKIALASNMNPKELNFHIFVELSSITKKGRLKALVWFWLIDETYWTNPCLSVWIR